MKRAAGLVLSTFAVACVPPGDTNVEGRLGIEVPEVVQTSQKGLVFEDAAAEWNVPVDVLKALTFVETRFEPAVGEIEFEDQPEPYGLMALRGDELTRASQLSGLSLDQVMTDDFANVAAAAALLDAYANEAGMDADQRLDPMAWTPALARYGMLDEEMGAEFARAVLRVVAEGRAVPMADGTTMIIGRNMEAEGEFGKSEYALGAANAIQRPSPNNSSRGGTSVDMIVIHTCEGSYSGCVSWLRQRRSGVSAHYVVNTDGEVSQLVDENRKAWHIGARYRSRLNSGRLSNREGQSSNNFSVGIEHGGRASQRTWATALIDSSIELTRGIANRHNVPKDRYHIIAHGQLQPESRVDPGPNWPWTSYLQRIAQGSTTPPPPPPTNPPPPPTNPPPPPTNPPPTTPAPSIITVDNNTAGRFRASSNWDVSGWASGKVGSNYRFRRPAFTSDPAEYRVPIAEAGRYEVFARVPGNGYNTRVPYLIQHAGGRATVNVDISNKGASWVSLGTYDFNAGDDWIVMISCWTNGDGFIIADAVRFERR